MPNPLYVVASRILSSVEQQIMLTPAGIPAKSRICVVPGTLAWDECECGLLAVEWIGAQYADTPPTPAVQRDSGCRSYVFGTFKVTMARCVPGPQAEGRPPKCAQLDAAAQAQFDDALAMLKGSTLAMQSLSDDNTILGFDMNGVVPQGPEGGCVAVTQTIDAYIANQYGPC
jgi:hypothetical protein